MRLFRRTLQSGHGSAAGSDPKRCPVCGSTSFRGDRLTCTQCTHGDRHRAVFAFYELIRPNLTNRRALIFSGENWLQDDWFASCERSFYGIENHLDVQSVDRPDESYDWVVCNHVLEHVENDVAAIGEMRRILSGDGVAQITVPSPARKLKTLDWGYPNEEKHGHYRSYGGDMLRKLGSPVMAVVVADGLTTHRDVLFLVARSERPLYGLADRLRNKLICLMF